MTLSAVVLCAPNADATTINFDNMTAGDTVANVGGVLFSIDDVLAPSYGSTLTVFADLPTSSLPNYLGTDVPGAGGGFQPGDTINLVFPNPITSLDVTFIGPSDTLAGAFALRTGATIVDSTGVTPLQLSPFGDLAFTLHLAPGSPFTTASLIGVANFAPTGFNIDDITFTNTVPDGGATVALMIGPLLGLVLYRKRLLDRR